MLVAKQVADLLTCFRLLLGCGLVWLGVTYGKEGLPFAVWTMLMDWTGDILDGPLARRSRKQYRSWWGEHDLEIDITVSIGLLIYCLASGWISIGLVSAYLGFWMVIFWRVGLPDSLGMLFQAPIYAYFIWIALTHYPLMARWLVIWLVGVVVITWPRFPQIVIPKFISGLQEITARGRNSDVK